MAEIKSIKQWLELIPDVNLRMLAIINHAVQEAVNMQDGIHESLPCESLCRALFIAFDWEKSPEGYDFWMEIHDRICAMEQ